MNTPPGDTPLGENTPGENTPGEDSTPGENGPPPENGPQGENSPPSPENSTPPSENGTVGDAPGGPTISEGLRADLCQVWVLGFLDCMKGEEVNDYDAILSDMSESLVKLSEGCIDSAASFIAQVFVENPPQAVYEIVYGVGFEVCLAMNLTAAAQLNRN